MIELRYHPTETCFLGTIQQSDGPPNGYVTYGTEVRGGKQYQVTTVTFFYKENLAIGLGYCLFPRAPLLGYHPNDIEFISIYSYAGEPNFVFFSAHSPGQGVWVPWSECETSNGNLVVYVARGSHASYPHSGTYFRAFGLANDMCSSKGLSQILDVDHLIPSYDYTSPNGIRLYKDLRPAPLPTSITPLQRFLLPFSSSTLFK